MGYVKLHERSKGEAIYRKGRRYISRDLDGHNGGAWKMGYISQTS
jgi:filamentous hemagglutinin